MTKPCSICASRFDDVTSRLQNLAQFIVAELKGYFAELQSHIKLLSPQPDSSKCTLSCGASSIELHCLTAADRIEKQVCSLLAELVALCLSIHRSSDQLIKIEDSECSLQIEEKFHVTPARIADVSCSSSVENVKKAPKPRTTNKTDLLHKPYKCENSHKIFISSLIVEKKSRSLQSHQAPTSSRKAYICDICPKSFSSKSSFGIHRRTHTGEQCFYCDICTISLTTKDSLVVHMRTHTNERPFMCHECCKTFRQGAAYRRHRLTHTGHRPHKCNWCVKAFPTKRQLARHILSHTGERPHVCPLCKRGYTKRFDCKKHIRNVHKEVDVDIVFPSQPRRTNKIIDD